MARYTEASCKLCRRERMKLFLKGSRCYTEKCQIERRNYPPGMHGQRRGKLTDYGAQLREKQKAKRMYGLLERQFRNYMSTAEKLPGITGENLLTLLERRLDNMVFRLGFATSRTQARQLVKHGHIMVSGKRIDLPSYLTKVGDALTIKQDSQKVVVIKDALEAAKLRGVPGWLELDTDNMTGKIVKLPSKEDLALPLSEQLIVELYSR